MRPALGSCLSEQTALDGSRGRWLARQQLQALAEGVPAFPHRAGEWRCPLRGEVSLVGSKPAVWEALRLSWGLLYSPRLSQCSPGCLVITPGRKLIAGSAEAQKFVSPHSNVAALAPQGDGVGRWGLWEVIRVR